MMGQPGATAHPKETSVRMRKGVLSGGHNLVAGHILTALLYSQQPTQLYMLSQGLLRHPQQTAVTPRVLLGVPLQSLLL